MGGGVSENNSQKTVVFFKNQVFNGMQFTICTNWYAVECVQYRGLKTFLCRPGYSLPCVCCLYSSCPDLNSNRADSHSINQPEHHATPPPPLTTSSAKNSVCCSKQQKRKTAITAPPPSPTPLPHLLNSKEQLLLQQTTEEKNS